MALLPLSTSVSAGKTRCMLMFLVVAGFLALIVIASMLGLVADSRDGADWKPTDGGRRVNRRVGA
jgi:hypothetical protein